MKMSSVLVLAVLFTGCNFEDILTENEEYEDEYGSVPPDCSADLSADYMLWAGFSENVSGKLTVSNSSPDETAYDVQCDICLLDGNTRLGMKSISMGNISAGGSASTNYNLQVNNPEKIYTVVECYVSWFDFYGNYFDAACFAQIY